MKAVRVQYTGPKNHEIDQWAGTATHWPYRFAVVEMPEDRALALVKQLPTEFKLFEDDEWPELPEAAPAIDAADETIGDQDSGEEPEGVDLFTPAEGNKVRAKK